MNTQNHWGPAGGRGTRIVRGCAPSTRLKDEPVPDPQPAQIETGRPEISGNVSRSKNGRKGEVSFAGTQRSRPLPLQQVSPRPGALKARLSQSRRSPIS